VAIGTRLRLLLAGWRPNRDRWDRLNLPPSLTPFPEARRVLAEFGGLKFGNRNDGVVLDPSLGEEVAEEIKAFERKLRVRLYPVGVMDHQDRHYLLVDEHGIVYTLIDQLEPLATSFHRALEYLIRQMADRRDVEADLRPAGLFGKVWRLDDAGKT
jgi:hypothetical protein